MLFTLHFRLILYNYRKMIHRSIQHFGEADIKKKWTYNLVINQFLKGRCRLMCNVMLIKICSKNSLFSNCYFGSRPKCNHLFYYLWNLKPSLILYSENLPTVLGYQASDDHLLLPSKLFSALILTIFFASVL